MSKYVESLLEQRARAWEQAKAILDKAADEKRELTAEEEAAYQKASTDIEQFRARADKLVEDEKNAEASEAALRSLTSRAKKDEEPEEEDDASVQLRAFLKGEQRSYMALPAESEKRALSKGTATAGGNTVPTSFYGQLWTHLIEVASLINGGATVFTTDSGEAFQIPTTTSHGAAAAVAEAGSLAGTDPAFTQRSLGAFKYGQLITVSNELISDTGVDLEGYLAQVVGWNLGNAFGAKLIAGAGTTEPLGITASTTLGVTSGTGVTGQPSFDNLIDLQYSVIAPYRNRPAASWVLKDSTAGIVRKIKDTTNNYIWQPSTQIGTPDLLLGKPVLADPYMPATALNAKSILFGDISAYAVRVVNGVRFERSDDYAFGNDQVTFRAILRGDGMLIDQTGAVKHFVGAAS